MVTYGWISLSLAVGVDCSHPQWSDLSFFLSFTGKVAGGGRRLFAGGGSGQLVIYWLLDWVFYSHFKCVHFS
jgi:hypothetical protein